MQKVKISELHLWAKNPRTIKDKRFEALCKSLTDDPSFMELRPILATKDGRIYAGNMRYRAAKELGWTEVPAIITDIPEKLANERAIKDNNEFGDWNHDELATLLDEMEKQGTDISTLGLDEQIAKILESLTPTTSDGFTLPDGEKTPFQQMTFTLHNDQVEQVNEAIKIAKSMGEFDSENENSNGNALARVCETFITKQ